MAVTLGRNGFSPSLDPSDPMTPTAQLVLCGRLNGVMDTAATASVDNSLSPTALPSEQVSPNTVVSCGTASALPCEAMMPSPRSGDRDVAPTLEHVLAAAALLASHAIAGDQACQRFKKQHAEIASDIAAQLADMIDDGLVTRHTLVCMISLADRVADASITCVNSITVKRVVAAAALLASKAERDEQRPLVEFATSCGISSSTLRAAEAQLFTRLDFDVSTTATNFDNALDRLSMVSELDCHLPSY